MSVHLELTPKILDRLRFDTQIDERGGATEPTPADVREWVVRDTGVRGLLLRLTPRTTTWYVQRKVAGMPMRRAIGHWWSADDGYRRLNLLEARKRARVWLGLMEQGLDPLVEKKKRQRAAAAERQRDTLTLSSAFDDYVEKKERKAKASTTVDRLKVPRWMSRAPIWHMPLHEIQEQHVEASFGPMLNALLKGTARPSWGPKSLSAGTLTKCFAYTAAAYKRAAPAAGLPAGTGIGPFARWRSDQPWPKSEPRTTYLKVESKDGVAWLKQLLALHLRAHNPAVLRERANPRGDDVKPHTSVLLDYYLCLLLWGSRRNETALLKWDTVDFERAFVTFPGSTTKTGKTGVVPLTPWARQILTQRRKTNELWRPGSESSWVFPSRQHGKALANARSVIKDLKETTGTWITPHDLRRTLATKLGKNIRIEEVGRLALVGAALNHATGSSVTADYIQEKAETLRVHHEQWEDHLRTLLALPSLLPKARTKKKTATALLKELEGDPETARALFEALKKKMLPLDRQKVRLKG